MMRIKVSRLKCYGWLDEWMEGGVEWRGERGTIHGEKGRDKHQSITADGTRKGRVSRRGHEAPALLSLDFAAPGPNFS